MEAKTSQELPVWFKMSIGGHLQSLLSRQKLCSFFSLTFRLKLPIISKFRREPLVPYTLPEKSRNFFLPTHPPPPPNTHTHTQHTYTYIQYTHTYIHCQISIQFVFRGTTKIFPKFFSHFRRNVERPE